MDLIQCTAPKSLARAWITGGIISKHIDDGILVMINESYDRDHPSNRFMQNVHFNYQYYMGADLDSVVLKAAKNADMDSEPFRQFFLTCLDKPALS